VSDGTLFVSVCRSPAEQTAYRDRSERMASSPSSTGRKNGAVTIAVC